MDRERLDVGGEGGGNRKRGREIKYMLFKVDIVTSHSQERGLLVVRGTLELLCVIYNC